jgi:cobalt/nickel transport system permease protein
VTGQEELKGPEHGVHAHLKGLQEKIAFLPDYSFRKSAAIKINDSSGEEPKSSIGTTVSGLVGGAMTLGIAFLIGVALKRRQPVV